MLAEVSASLRETCVSSLTMAAILLLGADTILGGISEWTASSCGTIYLLTRPLKSAFKHPAQVRGSTHGRSIQLSIFRWERSLEPTESAESVGTIVRGKPRLRGQG